MKNILFVVFLISLPRYTNAAYRVYQYMIASNNKNMAVNQTKPRYVLSTLDPRSYKSYHGANLLKVELLRTWLCPGYTGKNKEYCKSPLNRMVTK